MPENIEQFIGGNAPPRILLHSPVKLPLKGEKGSVIDEKRYVSAVEEKEGKGQYFGAYYPVVLQYQSYSPSDEHPNSMDCPSLLMQGRSL